jgi:hypothetical protein
VCLPAQVIAMGKNFTQTTFWIVVAALNISKFRETNQQRGHCR